MTTLLETRYRAVLRLLPAYYREAREEEMVETYLWDVDQETQDQSRPTLGEVASVAALALRSRLGAVGAPRPYDRLGSAVRLFALFAVLLQATSAIAARVLELTWSTTHGHAQWDMFLTGFTARGPAVGVVEAVVWGLPLLWTVGYFALLHDRRRLARVSVLLAALPTLWPLLVPLFTSSIPPQPVFATASVLFAWLTALALCAAHHRDAPPAGLPAGSPGVAFAACCVVMGASMVLLPLAADAAWGPATCFAVGSLAWLLWRVRRTDQNTACAAIALAVLGLLILGVRLAALYPWRDTLPSVVLVGALGQTAVVALLVAALAVVGGRDLVRTGAR